MNIDEDKMPGDDAHSGVGFFRDLRNRTRIFAFQDPPEQTVAGEEGQQATGGNHEALYSQCRQVSLARVVSVV